MKTIIVAALLFIGALFIGAPALAEPDGTRWSDPRPYRTQLPRSVSAHLELRADLQNLFHFKNDADFDRGAPLYDASGQTVGAFATIFTPRATLHILDNLRMYYEVELGLNFWSKQNPDQPDPTAADMFVLKHREIYGEGEVAEGQAGFLAGYSYFRDPTGLFVAHWIGVARTWWRPRDGIRLGLFVGQVPDQTHEGIVLADNNFRRDIWIFGGHYDLSVDERWRLSAAVTALYDTHLVDQTRWLLCPSVHLELGQGRVEGFIDVAMQGGKQLGQAVGDEDQTHLAWAAQAGLRVALGRLELQGTVLALSPDDAYLGNGRNHAFLYSGKSRSATLMLTEDEIRDWYDNLDERASAFSGGFFASRAGLMVSDLKLSFKLHERIRPALIVGAATVLKPENALDGILVGVEADGVLELRLADYLVGHVVVGGLVPGAAGGALINRIDRGATDPIVMTEVSLTLIY